MMVGVKSLAHKRQYVHTMRQNVQTLKIKRRVMLALGWNDPRMLLAIGQYAREAGWHLETRQFFMETVPRNWRGEGLIVSCPQRADLRAFVRKQAPLQPTVLIGGNNPGICAVQVMEDNHAAGRLAALRFLERGHRNFAWFTTYGDTVAENRRDGFRETLAGAGFDCHLLERRGNQPVRWVAGQLRALPRPLACYALDDQLASELIEICVVNGWRVPEDIAVMGTGNIEVACECSHVPISSVDLAEGEIGRQAAAMLDRLMQGRKPPARPVVIQPRGVIVRQSTDCLALTDPALRKAVDYITGNMQRPLGMEEVATAAGVSRRTLYNMFRRDLLRTPAAFVLQVRFTRARELLAAPGRKVTEVATLCGFGTPRTMTRVFRRQEGLTAREWKKRNRT